MTRTWRPAISSAHAADHRLPGTIAWIGLATSDVDAARTFYAGLFDWRYRAVDTPLGEYLVGCRGGEAAGGMMAHATALAGAGLAPGWTIWFRVDDLAAVLATADAQGAKLALGPVPLRARARAAILEDPFGVPFGLLDGPTRVGLHIGTRPGEPCWAELVTAEPDEAADFYGHVLGWNTQDDPIGYTTFSRGRLHAAGLVHPDDVRVAAPSWLPYFAVADCRATIATVLRLGGSTVTGPTPAPSGIFAVVADPMGAVFAVFQPASAG